jgi:hypothetical protein
LGTDRNKHFELNGRFLYDNCKRYQRCFTNDLHLYCYVVCSLSSDFNYLLFIPEHELVLFIHIEFDTVLLVDSAGKDLLR